MVFALSTENSIVLGAVGAVFIVFALVSSFVLPARNPNFPGKSGLRWYLPLTVAFFIAMMAAVIVFGVEEEHAEAEHTPPGVTQPAEGEGEGTGAGGFTGGDATAGKAIFTSAGCNACHVLAAAGATGIVGPDLDEAKAAEPIVIDRVVNGKGTMPAFKDSLSEQEISDVVAFVVESTHGGESP
jgi:mono/diheme cytochrome c family protein